VSEGLRISGEAGHFRINVGHYILIEIFVRHVDIAVRCRFNILSRR
jgi:hypothetical protein